MIIPAFLLKQSIEIEPFLGSTAYGEQYGPKVVEKGRIETSRKVIKSAQGKNIMSEAVAFTRPTAKIKEQDRVTYDGRQYEVVFVANHIGLSSPSHKEVRLK